MKKQKIQLIILLAAILCAVIVLFVVKQENKKAEEEAAAEQEVATITVDEIDISKISAFSYYSDGVKISYQKEGENWVCVNDAELQLDNDKIEGLLENISTITAVEQVTEVEDLSDYGLLEPLNTISITMEEKNITYAVGDYNDIVSGSYVRKNDETTIYIVNGGITTAFTQGPENYVQEETEEVSDNDVSESDVLDSDASDSDASVDDVSEVEE